VDNEDDDARIELVGATDEKLLGRDVDVDVAVEY